MPAGAGNHVNVARAPIDGRITGDFLHHVQSRRVGYNTIEHKYRRQPFQVVRPPDGRGPAEGVVRCETCGTKVKYRVLSVQATEHAQRRRRMVAWVGVLVILGSAAALIWNGNRSTGASAPVVVVGVLGIVLGLVVALVGAVYGDVTGLRIGPQTGAHEHSVMPSRLRRDELSLTCPRCGHTEPIDWGQYAAAKARLAAHTCPAPAHNVRRERPV